ncbi:MAG TPA: cupredoxin domain-containing protein [Sphingomicrobium sp.]|nr:cupredoxin domain-containing protein [Sphingomicrobium sp.]
MNNLVHTLIWLSVASIAVSAPAPATGREHVVRMANMRYEPVPAGLKVGDSIFWVNRDRVPHTVTARNRSFDVRIPAGKSVRMTLKRPGRTPFYCILHPAMRGTLVVAN